MVRVPLRHSGGRRFDSYRAHPVFLIVVAALLFALAACAPTPIAPATPTVVSLKPANLLTPRPSLPTATPEVPQAQTATAEPTAMPRGPALQPTPTALLTGTPLAASEPLSGFLLDDHLWSPIIGKTFAYRIYLPPDYLSSQKRRYPVVYMLHGAGGNYTEWSDSFLPEQIDRMIVAGEIQPMIVVMPDDGESTYFANWDNGPRWGDYIAEDVVNTIDLRYRTLPDPTERAIGGLSMGGMGALNLAFQHPDIFGVVGSHSPSVRLEPDPDLWFLTGDNFWQNNPIWLAEHTTGLERLKIWLDVGTDDIWLPNVEAVRDTLVKQGLHLEYYEFAGLHEAGYWIDHVPDYLRFYSENLAS